MNNINIIHTKNKDYKFKPSGTLYIKQDPDQTHIPLPAKDLDVGFDLPVKINIDLIKFSERGEEPDKLRSPLLYPNLRHYVYPNGSEDDPMPWLEVPSFGWAEVPCGLSLKLPDDAWGLLQARSSTIWKKHLIIVGSTIDPGYTGQLGVLVYNPNHKPIRIHEYNPETRNGDKLGQLILIPVYKLNEIVIVDELPKTKRGVTGFGSTGGV